MEVVHFATPATFRAWLAAHFDSATELWAGFYRKDSGRRSITYPEALDEALCFGWIDGIRKKVDDISYTNRFTPRRARSNWSLVNIRRVTYLKRAGRMTPAGLRAFAARDAKRSGTYSFEQQRKTARLGPPERRLLRANSRAWRYFVAQAPSYQRIASWWVVRAKREETRRKRLRLPSRAARAVSASPRWHRRRSREPRLRDTIQRGRRTIFSPVDERASA